MRLDLKNLSGDQGADGAALDFDFELLNLGLCRGERRLIDRHYRTPVRQFLDADSAFVGHALGEPQLSSGHRKGGLGLLDLRDGRQQLGLQITVVYLEERVSRLHSLSPLDVDGSY